MDKIKATMIFEIMGKPPEYMIENLNEILGKLGSEKGVSVTGKKIREPKAVENSDVFTSFAEVEVEIEGLQRLMSILFAYMPANVDIISPSEFRLKNFDFSGSCNEILAKLHNYDGVAKTLLYERNNLVNQLNQMRQMGNIKIEEVTPKEIKSSKTKTKKKRR